jgi:hypothetical protein
MALVFHFSVISFFQTTFFSQICIFDSRLLIKNHVAMSTDDRIRRRANFRTPFLIIGITMIAFYIGLGAWLLLDPTFLPAIPADFRNIFAIMMLVYGGYRGWRMYADTK